MCLHIKFKIIKCTEPKLDIIIVVVVVLSLLLLLLLLLVLLLLLLLLGLMSIIICRFICLNDSNITPGSRKREF